MNQDATKCRLRLRNVQGKHSEIDLKLLAVILESQVSLLKVGDECSGAAKTLGAIHVYEGGLAEDDLGGTQVRRKVGNLDRHEPSLCPSKGKLVARTILNDGSLISLLCRLRFIGRLNCAQNGKWRRKDKIIKIK